MARPGAKFTSRRPPAQPVSPSLSTMVENPATRRSRHDSQRNYGQVTGKARFRAARADWGYEVYIQACAWNLPQLRAVVGAGSGARPTTGQSVSRACDGVGAISKGLAIDGGRGAGEADPNAAA